jgi:1,4-dihydroxy-2-naphthoate octaprenyltransferase
MGTYFLHTKTIQVSYLLPALSCGLLATAVLNINNIRDIESDKQAGKRSIPVRIGKNNAIIYHWFLLLTAVVCAMVFVLLHYRSPYQFLFLLTLPLILKNGFGISNAVSAEETDPYLKQLAISTLIFILVFGVGLIL